MNKIRRMAGWLWLVLSLVLVGLLFYRAGWEIDLAKQCGKAADLLEKRMFWYVILPVFLPIMAGLGVFGFFAVKGEYDREEA